MKRNVIYTDLRDRNLISLKKETSLTMQHYCQMSICSNIQSKRQNFISGDGKKWLTKKEKMCHCQLGLFKKQLFQAGTPANRFSYCLGQYKIGTYFDINYRPHLGVELVISLRYRSPKLFFSNMTFFPRWGQNSLFWRFWPISKNLWPKL